MGRAEVLQGVRQMRFEGLLERHDRGELSQGEAAGMLGVSGRTFRRWRDRLRDEGPEGLRDRRIGKPSSTPTGAWRPFTGHIGWPITIPRESCATARNWLRGPLRQPACGFVNNATRCPQPHRPNHNRSGQLMRYEDRSTWRV